MSTVFDESRHVSTFRSKSSTTSYTSDHVTDSTSIRRPSLKELPSYRDEACKALSRREELQRLKNRLSSDREILNADPSTKPWLRRSSSRQMDPMTTVTEDGLYTATPALVYGGTGNVAAANATGSNLRSRNLSRGTSSSDYSDNSFNSDTFYEY